MNVQTQEETQWCWAAVAVSIHNFLNPGGANWTQRQLATPVLIEEDQISPGVDCTLTPDLCNIPAALDDALRITGNLRRTTGFNPGHHLDFDSIKDFVAAQIPIGVRIEWWGGGGHFVVIDGFRELESGRQQVHVQDPRGFGSFQDYDVLVSGYSDGGNWWDTYLVKRSTLAPPHAHGGI